VVRLVEEELATGKRLRCYATVVGVASGSDPAREMAPVAAVWAVCPLLGVESTRDASARHIDDGDLLGGNDSVGAKSTQGRCYL
jgi:hypothetical protein